MSSQITANPPEFLGILGSLSVFCYNFRMKKTNANGVARGVQGERPYPARRMQEKPALTQSARRRTGALCLRARRDAARRI
jgi:hypothetical protein